MPASTSRISGADRGRKLGRVLDLLAGEAEGLAELGVVGAVDRDAVPHLGLLRDTVGVVVAVAQLHRAVLAVVADDNQDRPAVALRRTQLLDHRVVEERAVADQCGDRPLGRAELAPTGRNISFPVIKAFDNKQIVYGEF